ncbi:sensor histidine kinase [Haloarcula montana]|uniref:sensor histidine kinase n=1 Tax=Haloarcula montana TaxID=3111776 RepID=UPI002D77B282|nr:histidine kinase N-terminal 7TM domain-containing protein [Haloarcula sp. GH36]
MVAVVATSVLIAVLIAVSVVASYGFAWYSWARVDHPVSDRFALLMLTNGTWALFTLAGMLSPTDAIATRWSAPTAIISLLAVTAWFLFVVEYTGDSRWLPSLVERLVVGEVLVYAVLYVLNPADLVTVEYGVGHYGILRLPYEELGLLADGQLLYVYVLLGVSFVFLGRFFLRTRNLYRKQAGIILAVTLLVTLANAAFFAGITPHPRLDLTPIFYLVQTVGIGLALYRYDFLNVVPLAANTLLEEIDDPVFVVDQDGLIADRNPAAASYIEAGIDRPTLSDVTIDGLDTVLRPCDGGTTNLEVTTPHRDGDRLTTVVYDVRTTPISDRYDIVRGYTVVLRDVTDREAHKQALATQNERLEEFTGIVSHDLRNPLQVVDGKIELARQTGDLSHLDDASDAVDRMETMLEELLHLAREGQTIDEKAEVDLESACRAAWGVVGTETATLVVETDTTVVADGTRLRQVFENLFRNAVEHGGEDVTVTVGSFDGGFYVADDGPGIPEGARGDIFELGVTSESDGTGFGLAIVERIVEAHGWTIDYTDSEDGGARFEVTDLYPSVLTER